MVSLNERLVLERPLSLFTVFRFGSRDQGRGHPSVKATLSGRDQPGSYLSPARCGPPGPDPQRLGAAGVSSGETRRPRRQPRSCRGPQQALSPAPDPRPPPPRSPAPVPGSPRPAADRKWATDAVRQVRQGRAPSVSPLGLSEAGASRWSLVPGDRSGARAGPPGAPTPPTYSPGGSQSPGPFAPPCLCTCVPPVGRTLRTHRRIPRLPQRL